MKQFLISLLLLATASTAMAQRNITGTITDRDTHEAMEQTAVQLLRTDSSYVAGTVTNAESTGCLSVDAPELVCYNPILDMQRGV